MSSLPFSDESRLIEMIDAAMSRNKIDPRVKMTPDLPREMQEIVAAVFCVKFALYGKMLPPSVYEDLREDLYAMLAVTLGQEVMTGPGFKAAYDAARKDILDSSKRRGGF
jgi:hypothetical protein